MEKKVLVKTQRDQEIVLQESEVKKLFQGESDQLCEVSVTGQIR